MKDGYPDRVCDYCHLQLNTFHAFVKKAKSTSAQFANLLREFKQEDSADETNDAHTSVTIADMVFEDEQHEASNRSSETTEMEFIIDKERVQMVGEIPSGDGKFDQGQYLKLNEK